MDKRMSNQDMLFMYIHIVLLCNNTFAFISLYYLSESITQVLYKQVIFW